MASGDFTSALDLNVLGGTLALAGRLTGSGYAFFTGALDTTAGCDGLVSFTGAAVFEREDTLSGALAFGAGCSFAFTTVVRFGEAERLGSTVFALGAGTGAAFYDAAAASRLVTRGSIFTGYFFSSLTTTLDCAFSSRFLRAGAAAFSTGAATFSTGLALTGASFLTTGFSTGFSTATGADCTAKPRGEDFEAGLTMGVATFTSGYFGGLRFSRIGLLGKRVAETVLATGDSPL